MPKRSSKGKKKQQQPTDINLLATQIVEVATGQVEEPDNISQPKKNPAAVALGRLGGLKGGKARAAKLSSQKRKEIGKKAAQVRWGKKHAK